MRSFWSAVSVVMIVLDVEDLLSEALRSIPLEAEIIVADGGSTDRTVDIARQHGARVVEQDLAAIAAAKGNFDVARNAAAARASRDWVLFLDGDERISEELRRELDAFAADGDCDAYDMPRINLFWGKPVRLLGEDRQIRLLKRGKGWHQGTALHQKLCVDGPVGHLRAPLVHLNLRNWADVSLRFRRYLPSEVRHHAPVPSRTAALLRSCHLFRYYYVHNGAWRDGWRGLLVSLVYCAYHGAAAWTSRRHANA